MKAGRPRADLGRVRRPGLVRHADGPQRRRDADLRRLQRRRRPRSAAPWAPSSSSTATPRATGSGRTTRPRTRRSGAARRPHPRAHRGEDVDIVFEHPGRETFGASVYYVARKGGTVVTCASTSGFMHEYDNRHLWMNLKRIVGSHFANYREAWEANRLIQRGQIHPTLSKTYSSADTGQAAYDVHPQPAPGQGRRPRLAPSEGLGVRDGLRSTSTPSTGSATSDGRRPSGSPRTPTTRSGATTSSASSTARRREVSADELGGGGRAGEAVDAAAQRRHVPSRRSTPRRRRTVRRDPDGGQDNQAPRRYPRPRRVARTSPTATAALAVGRQRAAARSGARRDDDAVEFGLTATTETLLLRRPRATRGTPRALDRRLERRHGGARRSRRRPLGHGNDGGELDPHPGVVLRPGRPQTHARPAPRHRGESCRSTSRSRACSRGRCATWPATTPRSRSSPRREACLRSDWSRVRASQRLRIGVVTAADGLAVTPRPSSSVTAADRAARLARPRDRRRTPSGRHVRPRLPALVGPARRPLAHRGSPWSSARLRRVAGRAVPPRARRRGAREQARLMPATVLRLRWPQPRGRVVGLQTS